MREFNQLGPLWNIPSPVFDDRILVQPKMALNLKFLPSCVESVQPLTSRSKQDSFPIQSLVSTSYFEFILYFCNARSPS